MDTHLLAQLQSTLRTIRANTPARTFDTTHAALVDTRTGYLDGNPVRRLVITLRGAGCTWTGTGGGCTMCGHWSGTTRGVRPDTDAVLTQIRDTLKSHAAPDTRVLSIYNSGSMLNPDELAPDTLLAVLGEVHRYPAIRKVVLETRAEYVSQSLVRDLARTLSPHARLTLAMGLETADDTRRELCLNKGIKTTDIASAIERAGDNADIQLYVLAGIPFLTETEAIDDAVATIRCADRLGADEIHIEPLTIQRHTLVEQLASHDIIRLPSLYSLYDILRQVVPDIRPYVSPFMHMPLPERIPEGCPACTERLITGLLEKYNIKRDRASLDYPSCTCVEHWREQLAETDSRPLEQRIAEALDRLSCVVPAC